MKAIIESERRFTVTVEADTGIAAVHKGCVRESEWNGLTAFRAPDGAKIIVRCEQDLSQILARFVGGDDARATGEVVLIAPSLVPTANARPVRPAPAGTHEAVVGREGDA